MDTSHELHDAGHAPGSEMLHEAPRRIGAEDEIAPRSLLAEAVELLNCTRTLADRPDSPSGRPKAAGRRVHQDASDPDQSIAARLMAASLCSHDQQAAALADWVRRAHRYLSADETKAGAAR